jgi:membrane protease YdiL (CAAX protease family)
VTASEAAGAQRLDPRASLVFLALWCALLAHGWGALVADDGTGQLYYPALTAGRVSGRALELAEAAQAEARPRFWQASEATPEEALSNAIAIHYDLVAKRPEAFADVPDEWSSGDLARLGLSVLLFEEGASDEGCEVAVQVRDVGDLCGLLRHLYDGAEAPPDLPHVAGLAEVLDDWTGDRLRLREALPSGNASEIGRLRDAPLERGRRWLARSRGISLTHWLLVTAGALAALAFALSAARGAKERVPRAEAPWSFADGLGVLVRGDFYGRLCFVLLAELPAPIAHSPIGDGLYALATPLAALPLLWLVWRHLLAPELENQPDPFGVDPRRLDWPTATGTTLVATGALLLGAHAIGWVGWWLEVASPWSEGLDETLLWGSAPEALLASLDYLVWVPAVEELTFRGLLFFTLRKRLGPLSAALVSATIFSAVHFYSPVGFLSTLCSGVVWALAFERTRSLLPGMAAHAIYNGFFVAGLLLLQR